MPKFLALLSAVGTAAMLWVGGSIVIHGLEVLGWGWLGHHIHDWAAAAGHAVPQAAAAVEWITKAALDGVFGAALGFVLIPLATRVIGPLWGAMAGAK
jgi:predicted DNA repair protein MutK